MAPQRAISTFRFWLTDHLFRRLFHNAAILLSGTAGASLLTLGTFALTARALGPEGFGILMLIKAYVFVVDRLVSFQPWQALIKYGADALEHRRTDEFKRLIKCGTLLDLASAVIGASAAAAGAYWVGTWRGWDPHIVRMATGYSIVILFNFASTPTAILRLFNRFKPLAMQEVVAAGVKLAGVIVAFLLGAGLRAFLSIWIASEVVGQALVVLMGWMELRRQGIRGIMRARVRGVTAESPGLWRFLWTTNLNTTVLMSARELDTLVVGGVLGPAGVGLYKIAKQCAKMLAQVSDPLYHAIYPELAKLWAQGRPGSIRQLVIRSGISLGSLGFVVWVSVLLLGRVFLGLAFGPAFVAAYPALLWCMSGVVIDVTVIPLHPVLLAMGRPGLTFWIHVAGTLCFLPALIGLSRAFGVTGAGMAFFIYLTVIAVSTVSVVAALLRQHEPDPATIPIEPAPAEPVSL